LADGNKTGIKKRYPGCGLERREKQENIKRKGKENDKGRAVGHVESGD
jgi:hypothetical protein